MISIENVVAENFPSLQRKSPKIKRPLLAMLRYLCHEREFHWFEEKYPNLSGFDFVDQVLEHFDFSYSVSSRDKQRIPATGSLVIVSNHPIGSLDGLALLQMVGEVRRDVKVVANELLSSIQPLQKLLLPVDNMNQRTRRKNLKAIEQHLEQQGAVVIFPAGKVSRISPMGVRDSRWRNGFLRFAEKFKAPVVPVFVDARNSAFFYSLSFLGQPLASLWLVREMFKQARRDIRIHIGKPIGYETYNKLPFDSSAKAKLFKKHVYKLAKNSTHVHLRDSLETIAHPENRQLLRDEIRQCELLGSTGDNKQIYLYNFDGDSAVMREIARLRELSFRAVGEGSGKRRDWDRYDSYYDHIILWDEEALELVGAYRMVKTAEVIAEQGVEALYTHTLFDYQPASRLYLEKGLELGRSFVQPKYWGKRSLDYLWFGIGAYLNRFPEVRYLLGPVSISNSFPELAKARMTQFYRHLFPAQSAWALARNPYQPAIETTGDYREEDYPEAFSRLKRDMATLGVSVPTLYKQYSEVCEPGGVQFVDFNVDEEFSDCIDGLVTVDIAYLKESRRKRYLGK
jgi:putative hemolysin